MHVVVAIAALAVASTTHSFVTPDGRTRSWHEHVPPSSSKAAPPRSMPVVIVLHGGGGNGESVEKNTSFAQKADERGFIAVYPEGVGHAKFHTWNANARCCGEALQEHVDDVAFLVSLVEQLAKEHGIDRKRVFLVGHSNGAAMAERALCERPDVFAGAAVVSSPGLAGICTPKQARPVLVIHGTADKCASYEPKPECGGCWERALSSLFGVDMKPTLFSCDGAQAIADSWRNPTNASTDMITRTVEAAQCARAKTATAPVELCTIEGGGHAFPGDVVPCRRGRRACEAYVSEVGEPAKLDVPALVASFFL